jgi:hypothetical protein
VCNGCDWETALSTIEEMREELGGLPEAAEDFASSVGEKLDSFAEWIDENEHLTPKQENALENMKAAIARWLDHE